LSSYSETLHFLYDLQLFGIKLGLENIRSLCAYLGQPERTFPSIHIAGTNGKGSTAAMIASMLTAAGYRTGLYTSPHLIRFNERIRINGIPISNREIIEYTKALKPQIEKLKSTFFEATTAIAFKYFSDRHVDIAVVETGLGGQWDATNVITPLVSIITNIGIDHTEHLGKTYRAIAFEKAGIIKKNVPCLTGVTVPSAREVLKRVAASKHARLTHAEQASSITIAHTGLEGTTVNANVRRFKSYKNLFLSLAGEHQVCNLRLALLAIGQLERQREFVISPHISSGLSHIQHFSGWRGRLDVLSHHPLVIADVAHNPDGVRTLIAALKKLLLGKCVVVFGVMKDKDYRTMIEEIAPITRFTVAVRPQLDRALDCPSIASEFHRHRSTVLIGESVSGGLAMAYSNVKKNEAVVVTGSHYVVGEAMNGLGITL
jgi:dihydrofolate synthase/folylpolyglutamate synthase